MIIISLSIIMGNLCIVRWGGKKVSQDSKEIENENKQLHQSESQSIQEEIFADNSQRKRKLQNKRKVFDPFPIFKPTFESEEQKIKSLIPQLYQMINDDSWRIYPRDIEDLQKFANILQHIEDSSAITLRLALFKNSAIECQKALAQSNRNKGQKYNNQKSSQGQIYASLFKIRFLWLKKLKISAQSIDHPQAIVSLQVLQYLNSPNLEELYADADNLTSIRFLRKCHWKRLTTLTLRNTKIADSSQFASVLPCMANSQHIQTINLNSKMSPNWIEISWILKMGFSSARKQVERLKRDDEYFYNYDGKYLSRIEFGLIGNNQLRGKHLEKIRRKFNNSLIDNPISIW